MSIEEDVYLTDGNIGMKKVVNAFASKTSGRNAQPAIFTIQWKVASKYTSNFKPIRRIETPSFLKCNQSKLFMPTAQSKII